MPSPATILLSSFGLACLLLLPPLQAATDFECERGVKVAASIGEGVTMHSCSWEQTPGKFVRTGPLRLVKHDILILQLQTDSNGKLHGEYREWSDAGMLTESGYYQDGLKEGEWRSIDANGLIRVIVYRAGVAQNQ